MSSGKPPTAYQRHRQSAGERQREIALAGQDIGDIPDVVNIARKALARTSFRAYCDEYFPSTFYLPWSADHIKIIAKIEHVVLNGGQLAMAMPRGSGKTGLCERACMWAVSYGYRMYPVLIGSDQGGAESNLDTIYTEFRVNDRLNEDFPEICYPIRKIEGVHQRKLRYRGKLVHFEFTASRMVLPTIPGSAAADAVIEVAGLTARLRGRKYTRQDGRTVRPDLAMVDDPQTDESARSPSQVAERERLIAGAVLGMAGPGKEIAALMTVTVVCPGDLAERVLNRSRYPEWQGERTKLVYKFPNAMGLWEQYWQIRSAELQNDGDGSKATAFYAERQAAMDDGAEVAWAERRNPDELSAIQHAMNLRFRNPDAFHAEYQNEPVAPKAEELQTISPETIAQQINGVPRELVPQFASRVTAFIDVQGKALYWLVLATADDFTGSIVDYGVFPEQHRAHHTLSAIKQTIQTAAAAAGVNVQGVEGAIMWALEQITGQLLAREWRREDGAHLKIERCLVDANWGESTEVVYQFCRNSPHAAVLMPSHGRYIGATSRPWSEWTAKQGDRAGLHWRIPGSKGRRTIRYVLHDTNWWKTFVHGRFRLARGDRGGYTINGKDKREHQLLADHLTAEAPVLVTAKERSVNEWKLRQPGLDNHWLDGLVGATIAASMQGAALLGMTGEGQKRARKNYKGRRHLNGGRG